MEKVQVLSKTRETTNTIATTIRIIILSIILSLQALAGDLDKTVNEIADECMPRPTPHSIGYGHVFGKGPDPSAPLRLYNTNLTGDDRVVRFKSIQNSSIYFPFFNEQAEIRVAVLNQSLDNPTLKDITELLDPSTVFQTDVTIFHYPYISRIRDIPTASQKNHGTVTLRVPPVGRVFTPLSFPDSSVVSLGDNLLLKDNFQFVWADSFQPRPYSAQPISFIRLAIAHNFTDLTDSTGRVYSSVDSVIWQLRQGISEYQADTGQRPTFLVLKDFSDQEYWCTTPESLDRPVWPHFQVFKSTSNPVVMIYLG
ncbi:MAG: hypothetical protein LBC25_01685, partial [Holosporales bacterium]|nr:hypothetical protein [Holosporales bacterium]